VESNLQNHLALIEYALQKEKFTHKESLYLKQISDEFARILDSRITFINDSGIVMADSDVPVDQLSVLENHINRPEVKMALTKGFGTDIRMSSSVGHNLIYKAKQIKINNKSVGFARIAFKTEQFEQMLAATRTYFIIAGFLVLIISSLLVGIFSQKITNNLFEIIDKAKKIARGDLSARIQIDSNDELARLGENLNDMAEKLADSLKKLKRDKTNLNTVLSSVNDGIIALDHKKKISFLNQQALMIFNLNGNDLTGQKISGIISDKFLLSLVNTFFKNRFLIKEDFELNDRMFDVVITPLKIIGKKDHGAVMVIRDITNFKLLEKIRREFVANVSHEFKTPIAAIRGYAETLLDWALKDEKVNTRYTEKIIKQSQQLENLVADLLELARIEKMQNIEFVRFNPIPLIENILAEFNEVGSTKKLTISFELKAATEVKIFGDPEMFRSIIINLVDNAIKYTAENGRINLELLEKNKQVIFSVSDTGIGIPEKEQKRIFERFYRVDKARSRAQGGTGLGLSIVKHLAELQGAEITLDSIPGKGSHFKVWFKHV
jgi:two-component system phosphate regulon sensor histidine kinase PhoR